MGLRINRSKIVTLFGTVITICLVGSLAVLGTTCILYVFLPLTFLSLCGVVLVTRIFAKSVLSGFQLFQKLFLSLFSILSPLVLSVWLSCLLPALPPLGSFVTFQEWSTSETALLSTGALLLYLHTSVFLQSYFLAAKPVMRSTCYLIFVSYPCSFYFTFILLSTLFLPFAILSGLTRLINGEVVWFKGPEVDLSKLTTSTSYAAHFAPAIVLAVPFLLSLFGLWQSLRYNPWQEVHCSLSDRPEGKALVRVPSCTSAVKDAAAESHVLRIVQITDPHLGPFMSVSHLSKICTETVALDPDLVLLTGDFHTPESENTPNTLYEALLPLQQLKGRVFACNGNHDHDSRHVQNAVKRELAQLGVKLLVDSSVVVETSVGRVQIVGVDWPSGPKKLYNVLRSTCPPISGVPRIVLVHTPDSFKSFPHNDGSFAVAGHTHGGQIGLLSLGMNFTLLGLLGEPDHGLWGSQGNLLYVHRGTGFRSLTCNYVCRVGVPGENSVIHLSLKSKRDSAEPLREQGKF